MPLFREGEYLALLQKKIEQRPYHTLAITVDLWIIGLCFRF